MLRGGCHESTGEEKASFSYYGGNLKGVSVCVCGRERGVGVGWWICTETTCSIRRGGGEKKKNKNTDPACWQIRAEAVEDFTGLGDVILLYACLLREASRTSSVGMSLLQTGNLNWAAQQEDERDS